MFVLVSIVFFFYFFIIHFFFFQGLFHYDWVAEERARKEREIQQKDEEERRKEKEKEREEKEKEPVELELLCRNCGEKLQFEEVDTHSAVCEAQRNAGK